MSLVATNYSFDGQTEIYRGEVRDVYSIGNVLISVATDRLTVFGHHFTQGIPYKGQVTNQITNFFAEKTEDIIPNWIVDSPDPNVSIGKKCKRFDINMVIRGSLAGHAWRIYQAGSREICGVEMPDGMQEYDLFDEPIITPTTKSPNGYEEDISGADIVANGILTESEYERLSIVSRQLFIRGKQIAREQGLILADTRYEFGKYEDEIYLIDEIHTPDSSRYFYLDEYEDFLKDRSRQLPRHMSTEVIRNWLLEQGFSGLDGQVAPELEESRVSQLTDMYVELYEQLTGGEFIRPDQSEAIEKRIENNILSSLSHIFLK